MGFFDKFKKNKGNVETVNTVENKPFFETFAAISDAVGRESRVIRNQDIIYQNVLTDNTKDRQSYFNNIKPQYLNQIYKKVPLHNAIINYITSELIKNYKFEYAEKDYINLKTFLNVKLKKVSDFDNFDDFIMTFMKDYLIQGNLYFKINKNNGVVSQISHIQSERMRVKGDMDYNITGYVYSTDWVYSSRRKEYDCYKINSDNGISIMSYFNKLPDYKYYGDPDYISALEYLETAANVPTFHKDNIVNGVYPSIILSIFQRMDTDEKRQNFRKQLENLKDNRKKIAVLTPDVPENAPVITRLNANGVDKEFLRLGEDIDRAICYSWGIDPAVMGLRTPGSLGNSSEIQFQTEKFDEKLLKYKSVVTKLINKFLKITGNENIKFKYDK